MKRLFVAGCLMMACLGVMAQRTTQNLNEHWTFRFGYEFDKKAGIEVNLPHTWNAQDGAAGNLYYHRGIGNYTKKVMIPSEWKERRVFIRFEGANNIAHLFVNGRIVGEHRGGYTAFTYDLSDRLNYGEENELWVRVNNSEQLDIIPLVGDFNIWGGIYRDVYFVVTDKACISPLDYSSDGVYIRQTNVSEKKADVAVKTLLSNSGDTPRHLTLHTTVKDGDKVIAEDSKKVELPAHEAQMELTQQVTIRRPHLWNGTEDPFMYQTIVRVMENGMAIDEISQPLGLRYYRFDANEGFFLNGKHLKLQGVCRHQDRAGIGNALHREHHEEDARLMVEMGVNSLRGSHYPHAHYFYDLMDRYGIVTWAEIPFVGPGGYADKGFVDTEALKANVRQQLHELIRQNGNHPSICVWGLFNELKSQGDNPVEFIRELNDIAHAEDATRPTTAASNQYPDDMNLVTDEIAFNRYDGWYGDTPNTLAEFLDAFHREHPDCKVGISEYGAGASVFQQQDSLTQSVPTSRWHPENWQTWYHIANWKIIRERPFVWGSYIWNMFDFGAANRTEGDRNGINDKGLVTQDRKTCKDAYYFYQANWSRNPMVYIEGRRNIERRHAHTQVMVFSNMEQVSLMVNGKEISTQKPDDYRICTFQVDLQQGRNILSVKASNADGTLREDSVEWMLMN